MRLALLGVDSLVLDFLRQLPEGMQIVSGCELGDAEAEVLALQPGMERVPHWEALLSGGLHDAVIVGAGHGDERAEQARRLASAGLPLLVSHPLRASSLAYYEIDMVRREAAAAVLPMLAARLHPATAQLQSWIRDAAGPLGLVEQAVFERAMRDRAPETVLDQFTRDVDLLRLLCGELTQISAMRPLGSETVGGNMAVHLSGQAGILARWSVEPAGPQPGGRLTLLGQQGRAVLHMPEGNAPWRLEGPPPDQSATDWPDWQPARALAEEFLRAVEGAASEPDWLDAVRTIELREAAERSLRRGRQVELRWDENVEESNFKSTMTALGCGLLIFGLLTLLFVAAAQKLAEQMGFRRIAAGLGEWPIWTVVLLAVFLLLQLLRFAFPAKERPSPTREEK